MQVTDFTHYACTWGAEPPPVQEIVDVARRAEDLGFHSLQIPHVPVLPYPEERPPRNGIAGFIPDRYQYDALVRLPSTSPRWTGGRGIAGFGLGYGPPHGRAPSLESGSPIGVPRC